MPVDPKTDKFLHSKLPIDADEKILAIFRHHWFAYASVWLVGVIIAIVLMGAATVLAAAGSDTGSQSSYSTAIIVGAGVLAALVLLGTAIPVYLRTQEQLVLTDEALLQILQPSLFSNKVDQLSLQHIADVTVKQDFFGTLFGYGFITVETPGEQNNFVFSMIPNAHDSARMIISAHENFDAALQAGRVSTNYSKATDQAPRIDLAEYQEFLEFQRAKQASMGQATTQPSGPAEEHQENDPTKQS